MKLWALIPAAGVGSRCGGDLPKQYWQLNTDSCVLDCALKPLLSLTNLKRLIVCLAKDDQNWQKTKYAKHSKIIITEGGATRAQTVLNGLFELAKLGAGPKDFVLVHDGARPNLALADLHKLIAEVKDDDCGGILAHPLTDSLKLAVVNQKGVSYIQKSVERQNLWCALTPQMFRFELLKQALGQYPNVTDEAEALTLAGYKVRLVMGERANFKLTFASDLALFGQTAI